jgi:hypothetical protein
MHQRQPFGPISVSYTTAPSLTPVLQEGIGIGVVPTHLDQKRFAAQYKLIRQNRANIKSMQEVAQLLLNEGSSKSLEKLK